MTHVQQTRLTHFFIHVLVLVTIFTLQYLRLIPLPVLYGVFLYMGLVSLWTNQFYERVLLLGMQPSRYPKRPYPAATPHVPLRELHGFTAVQLFLFGALYVIKSVKSVSIMFPLIIALCIPVRLYLMPKIFSPAALVLIDGDDDEIRAFDGGAAAAKEATLGHRLEPAVDVPVGGRRRRAAGAHPGAGGQPAGDGAGPGDEPRPRLPGRRRVDDGLGAPRRIAARPRRDSRVSRLHVGVCSRRVRLSDLDSCYSSRPLTARLQLVATATRRHGRRRAGGKGRRGRRLRSWKSQASALRQRAEPFERRDDEIAAAYSLLLQQARALCAPRIRQDDVLTRRGGRARRPRRRARARDRDGGSGGGGRRRRPLPPSSGAQ